MADSFKKDDKQRQPADDEAFYIKVPETPQISSAEATVTEQELLARFKTRGPRAETLKPLAIFYSRVGMQDKAYSYLKLWARVARNPEEKAECMLMSGQMAEQIDQPEHAMAFYLEGLKHKPEGRKINYFLHNNLAFCLNQLGRFDEAITHCELALKYDATRANGYKNFGKSLEGLGRHADAVRLWLKAIHVDAGDGRALDLLDKIMLEHGEALRQEIPGIDDQIEACRRAIASAKVGRFADWARGLTLN